MNKRLYSWFSIGGEGYLVHLDSGIKYGEDGFSSPYLDALTRALNFLMSGVNGKLFIDRLVDMAEVVVIRCETDKANLENKYDPNKQKSDFLVDKVYTNIKGSVNWYSPDEMKKNGIEFSKVLNGKIYTEYNLEESAFSLIHELTHFYDHVKIPRNLRRMWRYTSGGKRLLRSEIHATHVENLSRVEHGSLLRTHYTVPSNGIIRTTGKDVLVFPNSNRSRYYWGSGHDKTNYKVINPKKQKPYEYK